MQILGRQQNIRRGSPRNVQHGRTFPQGRLRHTHPHKRKACIAQSVHAHVPASITVTVIPTCARRRAWNRPRTRRQNHQTYPRQLRRQYPPRVDPISRRCKSTRAHALPSGNMLEAPSPHFSQLPTASLEPSSDKETEPPEPSYAASPSMSSPSWDHSFVVASKEYTRTCPLPSPLLPSFPVAPTASVEPSADKETEIPEKSHSAAVNVSTEFGPLIVSVKRVHAHVPAVHTITVIPKCANGEPGTVLDKETEPPEKSSTASPMSEPKSGPLVRRVKNKHAHVPAVHTIPPFPLAPMASVEPSPDKETEPPE